MYDSVIIVTGQRLEYSAIPEWGTLWYFRDPSVPPGFGYIYDYQGNHYVQGQFDNVIHIDFVPNDEQAALINRFRQAVENSRNAINGLHPDAELRLRDGLQVESYELKDLISKSSFRIDPPGTRYPGAHGQQIGQADYNGGYPVIRLSLDSLEGYGFHDGGLNTLVLHEIAHVTEAVRAFYSRVYNDADGYTAQDAAAHEQLAFDVSRAILEARSLPYLETPTGGYSDIPPTWYVPGDGGGSEPPPEQPGPRAGTPIEWMPRRTRASALQQRTCSWRARGDAMSRYRALILACLAGACASCASTPPPASAPATASNVPDPAEVSTSDPCADAEYLRSTSSFDRVPVTNFPWPFTWRTIGAELRIQTVVIIRSPCVEDLRFANWGSFQFETGVVIRAVRRRAATIMTIANPAADFRYGGLAGGLHPPLEGAEFVMARGLSRQERTPFVGLYQRGDHSILTAFYRCGPSQFTSPRVLLESKLPFRSIVLEPHPDGAESQIFALHVASKQEARVFEFYWDDDFAPAPGTPEPVCSEG